MNKHNLSTFNSKKPRIISVAAKFFAFILLAVIFFWGVISPQYKFNYNASIIDKMHRLETLEGKRIILVGNSNVAYGFRSNLIEEATGIPVVNLGLHGGLGDGFHEELIKGELHPGDLVIVCHSCYSNTDIIKDCPMAWMTIENHLNLWKHIPLESWPNMIKAFPIYLKKTINLWMNDAGNLSNSQTGYDRTAFNEYGDNIFSQKHSANYKFPEGFTVSICPLKKETAARLNSLSEYISSQGAQMVIAGYPIACAENARKQGIAEANALESALRKSLNCPVISTFSDYLFPLDYFYDTTLHLTDEGARARTNQLIKDLENFGRS